MKQTQHFIAACLLLIPCFSWTIAHVRQEPKVQVTGEVYVFGIPYADANHLESIPQRGVKMYVRPYKLLTHYVGPITDSFVTDSAGKFTIYLEPGDYSFISADSAQEIGLTKYFRSADCDSACFVKQLSAGAAVFNVELNTKRELNIMLH